jgi:hypothetical protein
MEVGKEAILQNRGPNKGTPIEKRKEEKTI